MHLGLPDVEPAEVPVHKDAGFVDEQPVRHGAIAEHGPEDVVLIDDRGKVGTRLLDVWPRLFRSLQVDGNRKQVAVG